MGSAGGGVTGGESFGESLLLRGRGFGGNIRVEAGSHGLGLEGRQTSLSPLGEVGPRSQVPTPSLLSRDQAPSPELLFVPDSCEIESAAAMVGRVLWGSQEAGGQDRPSENTERARGRLIVIKTDSRNK